MKNGKVAAPIILIVESDHETRPLLVENLSRSGYQLIVALDEVDALTRLRGGPDVPVLILINQVNYSAEEVLRQGRNLRRSANLSAQVPIVVMADRYGPDLEGSIVKYDDYDYIIYPEDAQQLLNLLRRLCL